ncbi:MAG: hypothetical protein ACOZQL_13245 [Myxococcota bacterium]
MKLRAFLIAFFVSAWFGCQCGPTDTDPCSTVKCGVGLSCDPDTGRCVAPGAGGGSGATGGGSGGGANTGGGGATGQCTPGCSGTTPVCDPASNTCKTCTETTGCSGATPVCQTIANGGLGKCVVCTATRGCSGTTPACDPTVQPSGACVQCMQPDDCPVPGSLCDLNTHTCTAPGTGGGSGGGSGSGGGTGTGGGSGSTNPPIFFDDAGMTSRCYPLDAGAMSCTNECPKGYECVSGLCKLRGTSGPVQATLRWSQECDLDLYLVEPQPDGGSCEIYYNNPGSDPNAPGLSQFCDGGIFSFLCSDAGLPIPQGGCKHVGWLDLDANRACGNGDTTVQLTNRPVENIIYSPGSIAPRGTYTVRANNWSSCSINTTIPYEVEVRANGVTRWYCGTFQPSDANGGSAGAGRVITTFTLP